VSNLRSALNLEGLRRKIQEDLDDTPTYLNGLIGKGVANSRTIEPMPKFVQAEAEKVLDSGTNANIVIGKDRPSSLLSGYGGRGDSGAGTVDIVAGRMSHDPRQVDENGNEMRVNPDLKLDASRIYISQKTDIDENFDLVDGKVGNSKARSAIGLKSDAIRIVGREGVKIVTGTDVKNSTGEDILSVAGIDLIAGNDDSDLQPIPLGNNLNRSLRRLTDKVDKLAGIVSSAITFQMKFNSAIMVHTHISPFFGIPTPPSEILISQGMTVMVDHATKTVPDIIKFRTNTKFHKQTYYSVSGKRYINSSFNNTN
jgi:hypothetical protein